MSNTIISLKHSLESGNVPAGLANGELALNQADGRLFYRAITDGSSVAMERYTGPGGLDTEIQFNDGGILNGNSGLTFDKTTGVLTVSGTNVVGTIDTSFAHANGAFDKANSANIKAQGAYDTANLAISGASFPFTANSDYWIASGSQSVFYASSEQTLNANNCIVTLDGLIQVPSLHYITVANSISFYSTPTLNTVIELRTLQNLATGIQDSVGVTQSDSIAYAIALGS